MYQGKFSSSNNKQKELNQELLAARNKAKTAAPAQNQANPDILRPQKNQPDPRQSQPQRPQQSQRQMQRPQQPQQNQRQMPPMPQQNQRQMPPMQRQNPYQGYASNPGYAPYQGYPQQAYEEPQKQSHLGTVVFYTLYFLFIALFCGATFLGLKWLDGWLVRYEAAQPTAKCQEVFDQLFANPDWDKLYDLSGQQPTQYEGKEAFVAYMSQKYADPSQLSYAETSAGISTDKKYILRYGEEKIGYFTLSGGGDITDIPEWELGEVALYVTRNESFRITLVDGHTAYVNGTALTEDHVIQIASTKVTEYLPVGVTSPRTCVQEITGLLVKPDVVVKNSTGTEATVTYDEDTRMFTEQTEANTISSDLQEVALTTGEVYGKYLIRAVSADMLASKFNRSSAIFNAITSLEWLRTPRSYTITNESVSEYARYSEDVFSARVKLDVNTVSNTDGSEKTFNVDSTFFFNKGSDGKWTCYNMTNSDISQPVGQVRLTFMNGETVIDSGFYATDAKELTLPVVSEPEGKKFVGWVKQSINENGATELTVMFSPDENGKVSLASGAALEPMTLYTYFEDK